MLIEDNTQRKTVSDKMIAAACFLRLSYMCVCSLLAEGREGFSSFENVNIILGAAERESCSGISIYSCASLLFSHTCALRFLFLL